MPKPKSTPPSKSKKPPKGKKPKTAPGRGEPGIISKLMDEVEHADRIGALPDSGPDLTAGPRYRTRAEIRLSCAQLFDEEVRPILSIGLKRLRSDLEQDPTRRLDSKGFQVVQGAGQLLASVGVGQVGAGQIDPAEIPNLPAPVFATVDPEAPLPDGKPE